MNRCVSCGKQSIPEPAGSKCINPNCDTFVAVGSPGLPTSQEANEVTDRLLREQYAKKKSEPIGGSPGLRALDLEAIEKRLQTADYIGKARSIADPLIAEIKRLRGDAPAAPAPAGLEKLLTDDGIAETWNEFADSEDWDDAVEAVAVAFGEKELDVFHQQVDDFGKICFKGGMLAALKMVPDCPATPAAPGTQSPSGFQCVHAGHGQWFFQRARLQWPLFREPKGFGDVMPPAQVGDEPTFPADPHEGKTLDPRYGPAHAIHLGKCPCVDIDGQMFRIPSILWEAIGQMLHSEAQAHRRALRERVAPATQAPTSESDLARRVLETYCEGFGLRKGMPLWDLATAVCGRLEYPEGAAQAPAAREWWALKSPFAITLHESEQEAKDVKSRYVDNSHIETIHVREIPSQGEAKGETKGEEAQEILVSALEYVLQYDRSRTPEYGEEINNQKPPTGGRWLTPREKARIALDSVAKMEAKGETPKGLDRAVYCKACNGSGLEPFGKICAECNGTGGLYGAAPKAAEGGEK